MESKTLANSEYIMRYILILAFSICFLSVHAQRVSIAPTSFKAWGVTPGFSSISVSYKGVGVHYFHPYQTYYWDPAKVRRYRDGRMRSPEPDKKGAYFKDRTYIVDSTLVDPGYETKPTVSISYSPLHYKDIARLGVIVFDKPFPSKPAQRVNFIIDIGYTYKHVRFSYTHISNAWTGNINPGLDTITISFTLETQK